MKIKKIILCVAMLAFASSAMAETKETKPNIKGVTVKDFSLVGKKDPNAKVEKESVIDGKTIEADLKKYFDEAKKFYDAANAWDALKCEPKTGFVCAKRECNRRDAKTFLVLNKKAKNIKRCEADICDEFPAEYSQTGVFFNIQSDGPIGTLIRTLGDSRYKEISTVGLDAYIANGECLPISAEEAAAFGNKKVEEKKGEEPKK